MVTLEDNHCELGSEDISFASIRYSIENIKSDDWPYQSN